MIFEVRENGRADLIILLQAIRTFSRSTRFKAIPITTPTSYIHGWSAPLRKLAIGPHKGRKWHGLASYRPSFEGQFSRASAIAKRADLILNSTLKLLTSALWRLKDREVFCGNR